MTVMFSKSQRGMALLVVVVLTMLIALGAYRFSFYMESQYRLTRLHEEQVQAKLAALSGVEMAAFIAELPSIERENLGGLYDNPATLGQVAIGATSPVAARTEQTLPSWRFGLIAPTPISSGNASGPNLNGLLIDSPGGQEASNIRFGFENESAKLHIPTLLAWNREAPGQARRVLLALPGATEQIVDAWLRSLGVTAQADGAIGGQALIDRLAAGRQNRIQNSEEAQLRMLWFGGDLNQNYRLDPIENRLVEQLSGQSGVDRPTTTTNSGLSGSTLNSSPPLAWQRFLTWDSGQRNETRQGQPRVYLNEGNLQTLYQKLIAVWPADWANFVIAWRQYGPIRAVVGSESTLPIESPSPDFTQPASFTLSSPLDLVGAVVQIPVANLPPEPDGTRRGATKQTLRNPFSSDIAEVRNYLGKILDEATTDAGLFVTGRVDVSEAPVEVLAGIPGIDADLARRIVQQRSSSSAATTSEPRDTLAWLLEGGTVDMERLRTIEPYLASRNDVYSVQAVGYRDHLSPVYRCTVTIDARQLPSQIRNFRIWHPWDRGFSMDQLSSTSP
jgi:hypothetical protein